MHVCVTRTYHPRPKLEHPGSTELVLVELDVSGQKTRNLRAFERASFTIT